MPFVTSVKPSADHGRRSRFRRDIEGMRAVAVGLVVLYHGGLTIFPGGFAGVDIFFVISGFVITMQLLRELDEHGRIELVGFYGRRAKRLLPAAGVVLLFTTVMSWLMVSRVQWETIATDIMGAALYVVNWVFADRAVDYLAEDVEPSPVQHYWSLAVEEQFYFIWPVIILALAWTASRRTRVGGGRVGGGLVAGTGRGVLAVGLVVVVVLPSFAWSVYLTEQNPERAFFVTTTRLWELGLGALVAIGAAQWQRLSPTIGAAVAWLGLVAVVSGALLQDTSVPWPGTAALVPTLGTAAVIVGGWSAASWGPQRLLGARGLVWLGGLSYSLYLWHWPVLRMAEWQWGQLAPWAGLCVVIAAILPAWLSYRLVENPIRRSPALNRSPRFALSVGLNATLVGVLAGLMLGAAASSAAEPEAEGGNSSITRDFSEAYPNSDEPPPVARAQDRNLVDVITPDPALATDDLPRDRECQMGREDEVLDEPCVLGDPEGTVRVAMTGDSKMTQWFDPLDIIGRREGWQMEVYTKSGCAFSSAMTINEGVPYDACLAWDDQVFEALRADPPDVLLTSSTRAEAGEPEPSADALAQGYRDYWEPLADKGTHVIVLSNTPSPDLTEPAYECVADHPEDFAAVCTWRYRISPASIVLKQALGELGDDGSYIDMDPWVCPGGTCVGVYRNILTYRQGSHITATFTELLTNPLDRLLVPVVEEAVGPSTS